MTTEFSIEDVMTTALTTIDSMSTVREAAALLSSGDFHSLPIVGPGDELLGIVTSTDLIRYLLAQF